MHCGARQGAGAGGEAGGGSREPPHALTLLTVLLPPNVYLAETAAKDVHVSGGKIAIQGKGYIGLYGEKGRNK